jgi:hypothetical protein
VEKNKKLILALPVLLGIMIWVWLPNFSSVFSSGKAQTKTDNNLFAFHDEAVVLVKGLSSKDAPRKTGVWDGRDPFDSSDQKAPAPAQEVTAAGYELAGIFWNEQKPSAIVNDTVVNVGSTVGSSTVKDISPSKVTLFDGIKDIILVIQTN